MLYAVAREIGQIAGNNIFREIIFNAFKVSKLSLYGFGRGKSITDLDIDFVFALIGNKVYFIIISLSYGNIITAIQIVFVITYKTAPVNSFVFSKRYKIDKNGKNERV